MAGGGSYADALLRALGFANAAGDLDSAWPTIPEEAIVARAPDVIVDATPGVSGRKADVAETRARWARYSMVPAVRDGRVRPLADEAALRPGPGLEAALKALEASIAPAGSWGPGK